MAQLQVTRQRRTASARMRETMMEECFYCGEYSSQTDIDRLGKCPGCMEKMTRAAEIAARESMTACYTVGSNSWKMY
jgi:hypothetical protein